MESTTTYPRDMVGMGLIRRIHDGQARELPSSSRSTTRPAANPNILHGDPASEFALTDTGLPGYTGLRSPYTESSFEYGSRVGAWRLLRILHERDIKCSFLAVGMAIERNPEIAAAAREDGHEMVGHGYRWIDYQTVPEAEEREHVARTVAAIERIAGERPVGWMSGRPSMNTRRLLVEEGSFLYDRDWLGDELPFWVEVGGKPHLCVRIRLK